MRKSELGMESMKFSLNRRSFKKISYRTTQIPNVKNYQDKYNLHLDDLMMMFLLKIELKRIAKRKNSKTSFAHNNPRNTYIRKTKRPKLDEDEPTSRILNVTDELKFDTFDSDGQEVKANSMPRVVQDESTDNQIIIKEAGKEIVMHESPMNGHLDTEQEIRDNEIILKHGRGEKLTPEEEKRMEMIDNDLTMSLVNKKEKDSEEKSTQNQVIVVQNNKEIVIHTESKDKFKSQDRAKLYAQIAQQEKIIEKLKKDSQNAEKRAEIIKKQLEENLEEMDEMEQGYQKQMEEMSKAIDQMKKTQSGLQNEIEKKNEFISLERNDKQGYNELLEKLQEQLNEAKKENFEDKNSLIVKDKELEETEKNLANKIKELAESRSQVYDLKNQITHLKSKNQKLSFENSGQQDSKLIDQIAKEMETEKDILKFTQDEYEDHMKRIENIMTANETEKLLLQREIERLRGENENMKEELESVESRNVEKEIEKAQEEDVLRLQRKQRELEVMKDQNKKLFEDNKTLSNNYNALKKYRKDIKKSSDQFFSQMNQNRNNQGDPEIDFDLSKTGNPLSNIVLASQILKTENRRIRESSNQQKPENSVQKNNQEKEIRVSPPIRSRVTEPPSDHFMVNNNHEEFAPKFNKKQVKKNSALPKNDIQPPKVTYIEIQKQDVLEPAEYDRNEYLRRSKSPKVAFRQI